MLAAMIAAAVACGSKPPADSAKPGDSDSPLGRGNQQHAIEDRSSPLAKFHDTLAPRWHAERGPQRMADTCGAIAQLKTDADAVAASAAPGGADAAAWAAGGKQLATSVAALDDTCKAKDAMGFEQAFARVHDSFHGLMAASGGHREDREGHEDHADVPAKQPGPAATGW